MTRIVDPRLTLRQFVCCKDSSSSILTHRFTYRVIMTSCLRMLQNMIHKHTHIGGKAIPVQA